MSIKVQPFVIDAAVLDLIGNEFKFDHAKGLAEWLKNSADAYRREDISDSEQFMIIRLTTIHGGRLTRIECIDFVGMTKVHIEEALATAFELADLSAIILPNENSVSLRSGEDGFHCVERQSTSPGSDHSKSQAPD